MVVVPVVLGNGDPWRALRLCAGERFDGTIDWSTRFSIGGGDEMDTFRLSFGRSWITRAFGRNPLLRWSDRVEALLFMLVLATALVVTPVAGAVGTAVYEGRAGVYAEQARTRHIVAATVIDDSAPILQENGDAFRADARWHVDGVEHVGSVDFKNWAEVGDQVDVWVDDRGDQVAAPTETWRAAVDALFAGAGVWLVAMAAAMTSSMLVSWWLSRCRHRDWEIEWHALVTDGGGRTGKQTYE
jgi:hypothetical protein